MRRRGATGTKDKIRRLHKALRGNLEAIEQVDGSTFYFDPTEEMKTVFLYFSNSLQSVHDSRERPEPPAVVKALANAKDRKRAYEKLPLPHMLPINAKVLVKEGRCTPRSLVAVRAEDEPA